MLSGTPAQSHMRKIHVSKAFSRALQHSWQTQLLCQEGCSHVVVFTLFLTKGFQWQKPGGETNQDLGRNSTYEVSLFCLLWFTSFMLQTSPEAAKDCSASANVGCLVIFTDFPRIPSSSSCFFPGWKALIHSPGPLWGAAPLWGHPWTPLRTPSGCRACLGGRLHWCSVSVWFLSLF